MENLKILVKWIVIYILVLLSLKKINPAFVYLSSSICFLIGFLLRKFNIYPGKPEPLYLDFLTFLISLSLFIMVKAGGKINLQVGFLIILSIHLIYNISKITNLLISH
jgi:hypothetical protein